MSAASIFEINADLSDKTNLGGDVLMGAKNFNIARGGQLSAMTTSQLLIVGTLGIAALLIYLRFR